MDAFNYDPLDYYNQVLKHKHKENVESLFSELEKKSCVDVEENRRTVAKYQAKKKKIEGLKKKISLYLTLQIVFIVVSVVALIFAVYSISQSMPFYIPIICLPFIIVLPLIAFLKLRPFRKKAESIVAAEEKEADALLSQAWEQMGPLNSLFRDDMTLSLFEKTLPDFSFEKRFSVRQYENMRENYDLPPYNDDSRTVLKTLSGAYRGNPFVYLRSRVQRMGSETYHGMKVISWTETYVAEKGRVRTRRRTQTLHASVIKPKPVYTVETELHYGAQGAGSLTFMREGRNINLKPDKEIEKFVKRGAKALKKKSQKSVSVGNTFTEMTNSQFDVLFGATDRNNEVEFRVMFTPLAQTNMVELILSDDTFGDDFDFYKFKRHNIIKSDHAQTFSMDSPASKYVSYSYDEAKNNFVNINLQYFKSVYFDFAPLLAVPIYQDEPNTVFDIPEGMKQSYTMHEYEVMLNGLDVSRFAPPTAATECIIKADYICEKNEKDSICVNAYSYEAHGRIDVVPVLGGDGRMHGVPVPWTEYIPVVRTSSVLAEDIDKN